MEFCYAFRDPYPVSRGHLLIIPFRHTPGFFSPTPEEKQALLSHIDRCRDFIAENYHPDGYNIGMNIGTAAGQTIMHCQGHVIPQYAGDVDRPGGGVRGVVPQKRGYK